MVKCQVQPLDSCLETCEGSQKFSSDVTCVEREEFSRKALQSHCASSCDVQTRKGLENIAESGCAGAEVVELLLRANREQAGPVGQEGQPGVDSGTTSAAAVAVCGAAAAAAVAAVAMLVARRRRV